MSPAGPFEVTADSADDPVQVTVTNRFDVGALRVIKKITGDASQVGDDQLFRFELGCQLLVNGEPAPVELADDGVFTLSVDGGLTQQFDDLPPARSARSPRPTTAGPTRASSLPVR